MIELIERSDCPFCWKVRLALAELEVPYQSVRVSLGEKHPRVLEASPKTSVPVLFDGDIAIWESTAIIEYLNDRYGNDKRLFPGDASDRARVRLLVSYSDSVVGPALRDLVFEKRSKPEADWDQALIEKSAKAWREKLAWLEAHLDDAEYFGVDYSAADCALAARVGVAEAYGAAPGEEFKKINRWFRRVQERPSWREAYPERFNRAS